MPEENDLENELRQIVQESIPPVVFPDVQKVEVLNYPDIPAPIVNVPEPVVNVNVPEPQVTVNVPEPQVTVNAPDNSKVLGEIKTLLEKDRTDDLLDAMDLQGKMLVDAYKTVKVIGGSASGSQALTNQAGTIINPATEELQSFTGVYAADSASIDAFGRWRTSEPTTLFDSKQLYDSQALFWDDQQTSGSGTGSSHSTATATTTMSVSATTAGTRVRQTFRRMNYQPGKSQLIFVTFTNFKTTTGNTKRAGYFDGNNGLFFQSSGGTASVVRRTKTSGSVVDNPVAQTSWNLDTMDGNGASGINLNFLNTQIGVIDFEWLGVGRVRMGWVVDGVIYYCHEFLNTNVLTTVYMSTPNLPVRYEISNAGTGAADTFGHICSSVISEGGFQQLGYLRHADSGAVSGLSSGTQYIIMAGRLKSTHLSANIIIENISLIGSANDQAHWELYINGTPGAALTFSDVANSAMQVATGSSSHTHTGGTAVDGGYFTTNVGASFTVPDASRIGSYIDGTPQVIYLTVTPITNNITVRASVTWRELL